MGPIVKGSEIRKRLAGPENRIGMPGRKVFSQSTSRGSGWSWVILIGHFWLLSANKQIRRFIPFKNGVSGPEQEEHQDENFILLRCIFKTKSIT